MDESGEKDADLFEYVLESMGFVKSTPVLLSYFPLNDLFLSSDESDRPMTETSPLLIVDSRFNLLLFRLSMGSGSPEVEFCSTTIITTNKKYAMNKKSEQPTMRRSDMPAS